MARATPPVVLVVDDDPDVLPIAVAVVAELGYAVLEASNAAEALNLSSGRTRRSACCSPTS